MRCLLILTTALLLGNILISQPPYAGNYEQMRQYEGEYRQPDKSLLQIAASPKDGNLYMIDRGRKYLLRLNGNDIFFNPSNEQLVFTRDKKGNVNGYAISGQKFPLARKTPGDIRLWYAREPEGTKKYVYKRSLRPKLNDGINIGGIGAAGLDKDRIREMVDKVVDGTYPDVHSILIARNGKLIVEEYFYQYDRNTQHQLRAATGSVISALMGIALGKGFISGIDDSVETHFPGFSAGANGDQPVTVRELLSSATGHSCGYSEDSCFSNAVMVGRFIEKLSKQQLVAFARDNLFGPLGIRQYEWKFEPEKQEAAMESQLFLKPRDMLKFGMMYLDNGQWDGRPVIPPGWVRESLAKQTGAGEEDYGYMWWLDEMEAGGKQFMSCSARGSGGQRIYLFPDHELVVVITGGSFDSEPSSDLIVVNHVLTGLE